MCICLEYIKVKNLIYGALKWRIYGDISREAGGAKQPDV